MTHRVLVAFLLLAGCTETEPSRDAGTDLAVADLRGADQAGGDLAEPVDMTPYNPRNTAGNGPAAVDIGSSTNLAAAGGYALLAKTAISNVTGSSIDGNVGLSPAAATYITGFGMTADSPNVSSTAPAVVSPAKIYAASYKSPTPTNLTSAVLEMEGAYTDAAGRTPPDFLDLSSGNLGGLTLAPGLYTWGSSVTIPTDVTISGGPDDVWIFQISNDLDLSKGVDVLLGGGADAKNIFWQVAGQVTIHSSAHFEGIILSKTAVTLQTKATFHGRIYAQTMIALDNNAITVP